MSTTAQPLHDIALYDLYPQDAFELADQLGITRSITMKERNAIDEDDFAWPDAPDHPKYPIDTQAHLDAAATLIGRAPKDKQEAIKARAIRIAKRKGFTLPKSWQEPGEDDTKDDRMNTPALSDTSPATEETATPVVIRADGNHEPFTGKHSHSHSAFGAQGSDAQHDHEHAHDNDSVHDHHSGEDRATLPTTALLYAPIVRIDAEKREVEGVATSEAIDSFGTIFSYEASKKAFQEWIARTANVREMHERKAVGKGVGVFFDDERKQIIVRSRVSKSADGDNTWTKIQEGVLDGYSVGATNPVWESVTRDGKSYPYLVGYKLAELSYVDNASNPDGQGLTLCRADGLTEIVDTSEPQEETPALVETASFLSSSRVDAADVERAGARISGATQSKMHESIAHSLHGALSTMQACNCETCQKSAAVLDPDGDGDIDLGGYDDPDNDAESLYAEDDSDEEERMTALMERIMAPLNARIDRALFAMSQRSNAVLARMAGQPDTPTLDTDLIRSAISAELTSIQTNITSQQAALQAQITTITETLERVAASSSLPEVRAELSAVKETVERIAAQPAPGGPVLNGGIYPVEKRLANQAPVASGDTLAARRAVFDDLQRKGLLNTPELQLEAATATLVRQPGRIG